MSHRLEGLEALDGLEERIERMALRPEDVEAGWLRLTGPLLRWVGWQPRYETARLSELVAEAADQKEGFRQRLPARLSAACAELADNVARAERVAVLYGRVPIAHLAWLGRMTRVTGRLARGVSQPGSARLLAIDPVMVAPPLAIAISEAQAAAETPEEPREARLVELQLAAIDHIIDAAREETSFLERRRRLFEAARRLLLDADAALSLDPEGTRLRKRHLAAQIVAIDRLEARGIDPRTDLLHQARAALQRGERDRLKAALVALEEVSLSAGEVAVSERLGRALDALPPGESIASSLNRSAREIFGDDVTETVARASTHGREQAEKRHADYERWGRDTELSELALEYLAPGKERETLAALLAVDGCFEVGAPLCPVRVREERIVARLVRHPTREMVLTPARKPEDLPAALISDPRLILLDLAAGRLLARRFVAYERRASERIEMVGEARIYLLDGSTSMLSDGAGARARMRDAILVAELATLLERFRNPQRYARVVLFYRYFTKKLWPIHRVDDSATALAAMGEVLATHREGGTDIERALVDSFATIREARGRDPALSQAQIVLITDGQAPVREAFVEQARAEVDDMPIAVSVIALGEQNPALRSLVARQRARGERAFYHHLDDETLGDISAGRIALARSLHPAESDPGTIAAELGDLLDDLADLDRARHAALLEQALARSDDDHELHRLAHAELGLAPPRDGQRARREAADRDRRAVADRFARWFPAPAEVGDALVGEDDVESVLVVLATVVEVLSELGDDPLVRQADAVDIVERLLPDARLSPLRYDTVVREGGTLVAAALAAVHSTAQRDSPAR